MGEVRQQEAWLEIRRAAVVNTSLGLRATIHGDMFWGGPTIHFIGALADEVCQWQRASVHHSVDWMHIRHAVEEP